MLITKVALVNWKSYGEATLHFTPGANAIIGQNGAGKSSVLEAIGYAVFGAMPEGFKYATMVREGAKSGRVVVSLVSPLDHRTYEIERRFTNRSSARYQVSDPELGSAILANGADEVRQWVTEHLRLDEGTSADEYFTQTLGVPQGKITSAFMERPTDRKRIFDPLLRVDEYRKAADNLRGARSHLNKRIQTLNERLANIDGQLTRQPALLDELTQVENRIAEDAALVVKLAGEVSAAQAMVDARDAQQAALQSAETAALNAENARAMRAQSLQSAQADLAASAEARERVAAAEPGHAAYLDAAKRLDELEATRRERDKLVGQRSSAETQLASSAARQEQLAQRLAEIASAEAEVARLTPLAAQQAELEEQLSKAEQAAARLRDAQRLGTRLAQQRQQRAAELERVSASHGKTAAVRTEIDRIEQELAAARAQQNELYGREQSIVAEQKGLQEQAEALKSTTSAQCPVCEAELTPEHRDELIARNRKLWSALTEERKHVLADHAQQSATIARLEKDLARAQNQLLGLAQESDVQRAQQALDQTDQEVAEAQASASALEQQTSGADDIRKALAELDDPRSRRAIQQATATQCGDVERNLAHVEQERAALDAEIAAIDQALAPMATLDDQQAAARAERDRHADDHNAYLTHQAAAGRLDQLQAQVAQIEGELAEAERELSIRQSALAQAREGYEAHDHAQARERLQQAVSQRASADSRLAAAKNRQADLTAELAAMDALQQERLDRETERSAVQRQSRNMRYVQQMLRDAGPNITKRRVIKISNTASELFGDIMEDHRGRLRWDEAYELTLDMGGYERAFGQLSGGEQMTAALALRLALLLETSKLGVAFLDEPTAHMDESRRATLASRIVDIDGFEQLFVISHDDTFEPLVANYVRVVKGADGSRLMNVDDAIPADED